MKKPSLDYVQMNGFYQYSDKKVSIIKNNKQMAFRNRGKLIVQYMEGKNFKWLLYLCRTKSFKSINPDMKIYPSRYTQDDQFVIQMFGILNGDYCFNKKWYFYQRADSYQMQINANLLLDMEPIRLESIKYLKINKKLKKQLI